MNKIKKDRKGIINPSFVRILSFLIITLSLIGCAALCILAIWDFTKTDAVWRAIATLIVIIVVTGTFTFVNEKLSL